MSASVQSSFSDFPKVVSSKTSKKSLETSSEEAEPELSIWEQILEESDKGRRLYHQIKEFATYADPALPKTNSVSEFLDDEVFPTLLPALEETLLQASKWNCFWRQKCLFNGIDQLAEQLWNRNPKHPERANNWTPLMKIPAMKEWLKDHPRPRYPLSWLWTPEEAATVIQAAYRGYLTRRRDNVQEVRLFWKALQQEKEEAEAKRLEKQQRDLERIRRALAKTHLTSQEKLELKQQEDVQKSAKGFIDRVLELAWEKIRKDEEEWQRSMDREHIEPYMVLRRSLLNWDNMTDEHFKMFFKD